MIASPQRRGLAVCAAVFFLATLLFTYVLYSSEIASSFSAALGMGAGLACLPLYYLAKAGTSFDFGGSDKEDQAQNDADTD